MPPKAASRSREAVNGKGNKGDKKGDEKPKKLGAQQLALNKAVETAEKLYKQHERERVKRDNVDRVARQEALLDAAVEKERLRADREDYERFVNETLEQEQLAYKEYEKHRIWNHIPDASRLPNVRSESAINTFLSVWRGEEQEYDENKPTITIVAPRGSIGSHPYTLRFFTSELGITPAARRKMLEGDLKQCVEAYELTEAIQLEADRSLTQRKKGELRFFTENTGKIWEQVLSSLDFVTIHTLLGYDVILDGPDNEFFTMNIPSADPVVRFGLWVKVKESTRSFASLVFPNILVRLDPKSSALPKLPRALGLSKENVALRVIQLEFNPYSHYSSTGHEYYALNCVIKVDLLNFTERPKQSGDWLFRSETKEAHELHIVPYPPPVTENVEEDFSLRISFEVSSKIVMRQPMLLIGKWISETTEWEPCSHTFAADNNVLDGRRCVFSTAEFATFAILQQKGFDIPYEHWRLQPAGYDEVLMVLEGRRRCEPSDREFRILIQDTRCKLIAPEDPELAYLRENWLEPATLVRLLSQAGFNFALEDDDAAFLENIVPKAFHLEEKAYADIAQFCLFYVVASSAHNKCGEDADMALFRISKQYRAPDFEGLFEVPLDDDSEWHSVRYQTQRCAFAAFKDSDDLSDLRILDGHDTHLNLYTLFLHEKGEEMRRTALRRVYEKFEGSVSGDKGYMTYQQACSIFGFQMNDRLEAKEIKKRFNKLVLTYHPDHGGTSEQFQLLREAHKLLLTHRHDKGENTHLKGAEMRFRRMNYDEMTNTIHRQTADKKEYRSFDMRDFAFFFFFVAFVSVFYFYKAWRTQMQILRSRWSYTEDCLTTEGSLNGMGSWHPWRSDQGTRDVMDDIGVLQGSIRAEVVEEKRRRAPIVYVPWQPGGPFARGERKAAASEGSVE